jgi:hypothetical protein
LAKGEIHDLGYQRYVGQRRPPSTRWRVIMRHQVATAWKTWWRYKAALGFSIVMICVWGGLLFFASNKTFQQSGAAGITQLFSDAALPMSIEWFYRAAFYLSLTLGAATIAGDVQSGAFTFYFARSTRPRDYVLGKLAGYGLLVATLTALPILVMTGLRLGICSSTEELIAHLWLVPAALLVGLVITLAYAVVPLGFSALLPERRSALALWAAYYLLFGSMMSLLARSSGGSIAGAFDLPTACQAIAFDVFEFSPIFGRRAARALTPGVAFASIAVHAGVAITILWLRVSRAQKAGVGGAS